MNYTRLAITMFTVGTFACATGNESAQSANSGEPDVARRVRPALPPASQNLVLKAPISHWADAIPLGNGLTGGLLWGEGNLIRLSLDRGDMWDERSSPGVKPEWWKTDTWNRNPAASWEAAWNGSHPSKLPSGRIEIRLPGGLSVREFELDLANAEGIVRLNKGEVRAFFSAVEMIAMLEIPGDEVPAIEVLSPVDISKKPVCSAGPDSRSIKALNYPDPVAGRDGSAAWYVQECHAGLKYCVYTATRKTGGHTLMAVTITSTRDAADPLALGRRRCTAALAKTYQSMKAGHVAWWREFWAKSTVTVPDESVQKQYQFVRYLYGAGSRLGQPPLPLQGVWAADSGTLPPWKGDYHNDLNTQTTYIAYQAAGNFDEGNAWLDYLWRLRPTWQAFARDFYKTEGLATPGTMTLAGQPLGGWAAYSLSPTMTAWNAHLFYLHWLYTNDETFLRDRAYPWCRDVGLCMKGLLKPGRDGVLVLPRSSSPEIHNNYYGLQPNSNYDLACLKMLFVSLAEMGTVLGKTEEARMWSELEKGLGDHHAGPDGEMWLDAKSPLRESHRHQSNIIAFHPFNLITVEGSDTDRKRIAASMPWWSLPGKPGGKLGTGSWVGFSFPWVACACARTGDPEGAYMHLNAFLRNYTTRNGFNENGPGQYVFTLEANFLAMQTVHEMLLQTWSPTPGKPDTGIIRLFPAMPWAWHDASFADLRAEGGHRVSAKRKNNATVWFKITAGKYGVIRIRDNFGGRAPRWSREDVRKSGGNFEFVLKKGETLEATLPEVPQPPQPGDAFIPFESLPKSLAAGKPATASGFHSAPYSPDKAFDNNPNTRWAGHSGSPNSGWLAVDLGQETAVGAVELMELQFPSVSSFSVECQVGGAWKEVARGTTINGSRTFAFPTVNTRHVRLNFLETKGDLPTLGEFRVLPPKN